MQELLLYDATRKYFLLLGAVAFFLLYFVNAWFGRFAPEDPSSILYINGIRSWILMELVSPTCFIATILRATKFPSNNSTVADSLNPRSKFMIALFLAHYLNRAIISPLRSPSRSKSHISVLICGMFFNIMNGYLLATYLTSAEAQSYMDRLPSSLWYCGVVTWAVGFAGNVIHDEILMNIRRKAKSKAKAKETANKPKGEHYAIPYGLLFEYVTFPNYFCEWIEWLGFAMATSPFPTLPDVSGLSASSLLTLPSLDNTFWPTLTPPYLFVALELLTMFPRAYKGHLWYHNKFSDSYPKQRKIVIPFIL
ncbi:hypothetical protein PC9H_007975 [Pleurotus ostreatus]|uniref:3-oxo-5-alpha-steroid 4-dehydrogenase C-terminal domain-containing protein n=1 Tax=Pleurotus ostreatus TaxID=5322 RepID=A0A8H6ZWB1_PLEOS|nr:uncharacterized protein PC9H_007975 [Pleurotus ostreatus]KAF7428743.1 hypothetical protein PC9H_007975 [Pleurotus ostreatus]KAJ8696945.1 hypothetical protein PTI98_006767 [Pleurotus ostreatus]